jgi:hypothetical protein
MVEPVFRKSTFSANGACVEMADDGDAVLVRDSKDPSGPVLRFTRTEVAAWLAGARAGEFDDLAGA